MEAAVCRDLEKIFPREGVRRAIEGGDDLVEDMPILGVDRVSMAGTARLQRGYAK